MYAKAAVTSARLLIGATTIVCTLAAGNVAAKDKIVTASVDVSAKGLDLTQPADAKTFYIRLQNAAWLVCNRGTRADLRPDDYPTRMRCYQKALGDAVRASNKPMVTQIYLATHTVEEAAAHGIDVSAQVATR